MTLLDVPLSRTPVQAWAGELTTFVGGPAELVEKWRPLLGTWASVVIPIGGPVGSAHALKLINNLVALGYAAVWAECYGMVRKIGAEAAVFREVVSNSGMNCRNFQNFSKYPVDGDRRGHKFSIANAFKDLSYYERMATRHRAATLMSDGALQTLKLGMAMGMGERYRAGDGGYRAGAERAGEKVTGQVLTALLFDAHFMHKACTRLCQAMRGARIVKGSAALHEERAGEDEGEAEGALEGEGRTARPKRPKWSARVAPRSWPPIIVTKKNWAPITGAMMTPPATKSAPMRPARKIHQGTVASVARLRSPRPATAAMMTPPTPAMRGRRRRRRRGCRWRGRARRSSAAGRRRARP